MADYLAYWKPAAVDHQQAQGGPQDHAASNQYRRLARRGGDTVWLVTVRSGRLRLVTRIEVGEVTDQAGAAQRLGQPADDLWEATHHILAADGTAREIDERDIHHLVPRLRFESRAGNDRLALDDGAVSGQQFQTMRELTRESALLLAAV